MKEKLTEKQKKFVEEYLVDLNATQAAIRAGYSTENAGKIGGKLQKTKKISEAIQEELFKRSERLQVSQDEVIKDLIEIKARCMDEEHFDAKNAIKALELLGKHLGMFSEKIRTESIGKVEISWKK